MPAGSFLEGRHIAEASRVVRTLSLEKNSNLCNLLFTKVVSCFVSIIFNQQLIIPTEQQLFAYSVIN